ncbi:M20 family metallopeptidase [Agrobacterium sp. NPDC089420]|uniref:M20 family metallopeptidase n=1 Tax=Agrobacterium sp. NPDC089420 TaxID=3363918 RepID=UPI00384D0643
MPKNSLELAQRLIEFPSDIVHETEERCAAFLSAYLRDAGLTVDEYEFAPGRTSFVAVARGSRRSRLPLGFTGHLDVVPIGTTPWTTDPFGAEVRDGKLYGRGSCDMKSGVAAFSFAVADLCQKGELLEDVVLIVTAGEETGLFGAYDLAKRGALPHLGGLVVAEPTGNEILIGHKGCLRVAVTVKGTAAHTSMPHLGVNAIEKAMEAITRVLDLRKSPHRSELLGESTITVSMINAGTMINIVPDRAEFSLCARTVPAETNAQLLDRIRECLDEQAELEVIVDMASIETAAHDSFVTMASRILFETFGREIVLTGAPYGTDAAALAPGAGSPPTIILGPGAPAQAHQTDEYCEVQQIHDAEAVYRKLVNQYARLET